MDFTNIIYGTIGETAGNVINNVNFASNLSKFQIRYDGTGDWLECSESANITDKSNCSFEIKLKDGETLTTMFDMFASCSSLTSLDLSNFNTSNVTNIRGMFYNCPSLTSLDLSSFDISSVTNMYWMFNGCSSLTSLDLSNFNTSNVNNMNCMFRNCSSLTSLDLSNFDTSKVTDMEGMFANCSSLTSLDILFASAETINNFLPYLGTTVARTIYYAKAIDTNLTVQTNITYVKCSAIYGTIGETAGSVMNKGNFNSERSKYQIKYPGANEWLECSIDENIDNKANTSFTIRTLESNITSMFDMFANCSSLTLLDLSSFDTSKVTDMRGMFYNCSSLTSLNLSSFDTSKVTSMYYMFERCSSLTELDLSNFNTSKVTSMDSMFNSCSSLTSLNISNFNTSKVTSMDSMFNSCSSLTSLNISNFDTSKVTGMGRMFYNCSSLTSLDLSNFDTSKVTNMYAMFCRCSSLTSLNVSNFDTSSVTNMEGMFSRCSSLTSLDVSNFDTINVTNMKWMFDVNPLLTSLDLSNFDTSNVTNMEYMFDSSPAIKSIGMLYSNSASINKIAEALGTSVSRDIYYLDANPTELTAQDNINYVEYKETVSSNTITLNGLPNGVCDELDLVTGRYVKRVGEMTLDGTQTYKHHSTNQGSNTLMIKISDPAISFNQKHGPNIENFYNFFDIICDKEIIAETVKWKTEEWKDGINFALISSASNGSYDSNSFVAAIRKSRFGVNSIDEFKEWLSENPLKLKYKLAAPVILYPSDEDYPSELVSLITPKSFSNITNINISSDTITPSFKYSLKTDNYYDVQGIDTTSTYTTYNITGNFLNQTNLTTNYTGTLDRGTSKRVVVEGTNPMVIKGSKINDVPYFTGLKNFKTKQITLPDGNIGYSVVRNTGKNLVNANNVHPRGTSDIEIINCNSIRVYKSGVIKWSYKYIKINDAKPNTQYTISMDIPVIESTEVPLFTVRTITNEVIGDHLVIPDSIIKTDTKWYATFRTPKNVSDENPLCIGFYANASNSFALDYASVTYNKIQLEEGSTATEYEPYFENEVYVDEELELRSLPDGTCDELDLNTGILTRRINELVINSKPVKDANGNITSNWYPYKTSDSCPIIAYSLANKLNPISSVKWTINITKFISDKFRYDVGAIYSGNDNGKPTICFSTGGNTIYVAIPKSMLPSASLQTFKEWLDKNQPKIQYALETPIRTQLSLKTKGNYKKIEINKNSTIGLYTDQGTFNNFYCIYSKISDLYNPIPHTDVNVLFSDIQKLAAGYNRDNSENISRYLNNIYLRINKNKLTDNTTNAFTTYLTDNPINVWYKSISNIALTTVNQPVYINKGHTIQSSDVAGTIKYSLPTTNYYHLRDLKPNTSYKLLYTSGACSINGQALTSPATITTGSAIQSYYALINSNVLPAMYEGSPNVKYTTNYLEDVCYNVGDNVISNCGKNLFNGTVNRGYINDAGVIVDSANDWVYTSEIRIYKNKNYIFSVTPPFQGSINRHAYFYDINHNYLYRTHQSNIVRPNEDGYIRLVSGLANGGNISDEQVQQAIFQLEEGSTATAYEPYKSNIISPVLTDKLHLRSLPDGTCDTFNAKTGVITRRVGVTKLDTLTWSVATISNLGISRFYAQINAKNSWPLLCNNSRFKCIETGTSTAMYEHIQIVGDYIYVGIAEAELLNGTSLEFDNWLKKHPIEVYYALKSPTYETISTMSTNDTNSAFANGYTTLTNNGVCPGISYGLKTNNYYSLPTLATGKYTVNTTGEYIFNGNTLTSTGQSTVVIDNVTEKKLFCSNPITIAEGELEYLPMVNDVNTTTNASVTFSKADGSESITLDLSGYALNSLPNGVCDEIDVKNGMHIQRVGVLTIDETGYNGTIDPLYNSKLNIRNIHADGRFYSLTLGSTGLNFKNSTKFDGKVYANGFNTCDNSIFLYYSNATNTILYQWSDASADLVGTIDSYRYPECIYYDTKTGIFNGAYSFFAAHSTTVYYELAQPIVTPITDLNLPKVYAEGKVTITADSVLPKVKYRYPTNNSFLVDKLLPSTTYTLRSAWDNRLQFYIGGQLYLKESTNDYLYQFTTTSNLSKRLMVFDKRITSDTINPCLLVGSRDKYDLIPNRMEYNLIKSPYLDNTPIKLRSVHKNLFDLSRMKEITWSGEIAENQNDIKNVTIDLSNNSITTKIDNSAHGGLGYELYLEPNKQYIIHLDFEGDATGYFDIRYIDYFNIFTFIWPDRIDINKNGHYYKVFSTSTGKVRLTCNKSGGTYAKYSNIMITEYHGDTSVPEYEPYKEVVTTISGLSQGLMSIPGTDVRDELIIDNDSRKVTHIKRVGSIQLTKELPWVTSYTHYMYFRSDAKLPDNTYMNNFKKWQIPYITYGTPTTGSTITQSSMLQVYISDYPITISYDSMNMNDSTRNGKEAKDQILHIIDKYKPIVYYELEKPVITEYEVDNRPMAFKAGHIMLDTANPAQIEAKYAINQAAQIDNINTNIALHDKEIEEIMDLAGILLDAQLENTLLRYNIIGTGLAESNEEIDETLASLNETMI